MSADVIQVMLLAGGQSSLPWLRAERLSVEHVTTLATGMERLARGGVDLVLVGEGLPDSTPHDALLRIHVEAPSTAVVMLLAQPTEEETLILIRQGADDAWPLQPTDVAQALWRVRRTVAHKRAERNVQHRLIMADRITAMDALVSGVAHEINNPLAVVMGNLDFAALEVQRLMAGDPRAEELHKAVRDARDGAERVMKLVRDLSVLSNSRHDRRGPVDVRHVVDSVVSLVWTEIKHKARLVKQYAEVPPIDANEPRLGQVFMSLLRNAAQAIETGRPEDQEIRLSIRPRQLGGVVVEVADTGKGIPAEDIERIFDPFFTTRSPGSGTGLGLAISQSIISAMGGTIYVESKEGLGSTFRVELPGAAPSHVTTPPPQQAVGPRRARVLIVDDDPMVGRSLRRLLSRAHDATLAFSAAEALELLRADPTYDLILCDLMMPGKSGMDLFEEAVALKPELGPRFAFVTGGAFTPRAREFLSRVTNDRFQKPVDVAALLALIQRHLG
ncbi:MAG: ATP-binding protein [Myxococcota bacterium]